jgi:adenosylcobyric acid synthase
VSSTPRALRGGLMVCGTTSNAGKSTVVTALCRVLARRGVRVAPFKAQNMALNSVVTPAGHEIGRAQGLQAFAAGIEPEAAMNPILLKPTGERSSQVVVAGRPIGEMTAVEYHQRKPELLSLVLASLDDLRHRFDVVICEGAGSPTEINLLDHDIVNLRVAHDAQLPAVVVGDIDLGGVFAALYGTVALLPDHYRRLVRGFIVNKFRGDPALLLDGCAQLHARTGVPVLGVVPWIGGTAIDAEDSLALSELTSDARTTTGDALDVAVVALPRISNFTDVDPLRCESAVRLRLVSDGAMLGRPDLVIVPGTKSTVADLGWLRDRGINEALRHTSATVLGICGGYQMLGESIDDEIESRAGTVPGLGLLPVATSFQADKVTERCTGTALGRAISGYRIHHGRVDVRGGEPFVAVDGSVDGVVSHASIYGTTVHGLFEADEFRRAFLALVATRSGKQFVPDEQSYASIREGRVDEVADVVEAHVDLDALTELIALGDPALGVEVRP